MSSPTQRQAEVKLQHGIEHRIPAAVTTRLNESQPLNIDSANIYQ
jgi:hypothetical protein